MFIAVDDGRIGPSVLRVIMAMYLSLPLMAPIIVRLSSLAGNLGYLNGPSTVNGMVKKKN